MAAIGESLALWPVRVLSRTGRFAPPALSVDRQRTVGLLVVEGLIVLELEAGRARTAWLVGADDCLRPWEVKEIALTRDARGGS